MKCLQKVRINFGLAVQIKIPRANREAYRSGDNPVKTLLSSLKTSPLRRKHKILIRSQVRTVYIST